MSFSNFIFFLCCLVKCVGFLFLKAYCGLKIGSLTLRGEDWFLRKTAAMA